MSFSARPQFAVPSLEKLLSQPDFEAIAVVTQPDKPRGRGKQLVPSPVKKVALAHQLPVWQPQRIKKDGETLAKLENTSADAFVVVAYGQILSAQILAMPALGCINVHGSILPQYRGAAPIQWSLYGGDRETGITTMLMDEGMDTGAMLLEAYHPVGLLDNGDEVGSALATLGADLLVETLRKLERGEIQPVPQDSDRATYAPRIEKSHYLLDWSRSAIAIHHQVRAFYPNCTALLRGKTLKITATVPLGEACWPELPPEFQVLAERWAELSRLEGSPGEVVCNLKKMGPIVRTGEGLLLLRELQLAGKRPQSGWDFVNGMRLAVGEIMENG